MVMAFWNATLDVPHHEFSAYAAALAMLDSVQVLNWEREEEAAARSPAAGSQAARTGSRLAPGRNRSAIPSTNR